MQKAGEISHSVISAGASGAGDVGGVAERLVVREVRPVLQFRALELLSLSVAPSVFIEA